MSTASLVPLPIVLPLLGAAVTVVAGRWRAVQRAVSVTALAAASSEPAKTGPATMPRERTPSRTGVSGIRSGVGHSPVVSTIRSISVGGSGSGIGTGSLARIRQP